MPEAFLSYSGQDREAADRLVGALRAAGISVWYDADIQPGERWQPVLERQLDEADAVIVLFSPASLQSDWVAREWSAALGRNARVLPVVIGGLSAHDLPTMLTQFQAVDLNQDFDTAVRRLATAVTGLESSSEPPATTALPNRDQFVREVVAEVLTRMGPNQDVEVDDKLVFVVASFKPQMEPIFEAISAAAATVGLRAEWLRNGLGDYRITDKIVEKIRQARLIVADLSEERPNVYFELGYARGLNKTVITIAREGTEVHVDVRDWNYQPYIDSRPLEKVLVECFRHELGNIN